MLSQISPVTTATASQPGGNVMVKKNVLMGQMNQKQHAVSSTEKWCFSDMSYQSVEKLDVLFQHLQDDLSTFASVRTEIKDTKDSGH